MKQLRAHGRYVMVLRILTYTVKIHKKNHLWTLCHGTDNLNIYTENTWKHFLPMVATSWNRESK